jgi:hypothetical protein
VIIKFKNWQKFNPRADVKSPSWVRLDHNLLNSPQFYSFEDDEIRAFLYLLCEASKANKNGEVFINHEHARVQNRVQHQSLDRTIQKLQQLQVVEARTVRGRYAHGTHPYATNETNETNERIKASGDATKIELSLNEKAQEVWNQNCGTLPKSKVLNAKRCKLVGLRLKEIPDLKDWEIAVRRLAAMPFMCGENDRGWRADFDFFLEKGLVKAFEGSYERGKTQESFEIVLKQDNEGWPIIDDLQKRLELFK